MNNKSFSVPENFQQPRTENGLVFFISVVYLQSASAKVSTKMSTILREGYYLKISQPKCYFLHCFG